MGRRLAKMVREKPVLAREGDRFYVTLGRRTYCLPPAMWGESAHEALQLYADFQAENGAEALMLAVRKERGTETPERGHG
jgi:hypothetical protein